MSYCSFSRIICCVVITAACSVFLLISLLCAPLFAQTNPPNVDWTKVHATTVLAINELYNLHYAEAEKKCNEVIGMAPAEPRGHFFKAMTYFYKYRLNSDKNDYQRFLQLSQNTISVCETILKTNPTDSKALFYIGGSYGYRGIIRAFTPPEERTKNIMQAVWDGKKGYDYLNDAVKADPTNADAQMGFGLFNCLVAQAPAFIKPAIKLAGFTTDRNLGLKQLENAAANGVYTRPEAQFWLSTFYTDLEETTPRAVYHLKNLLVQFPQNYWYKISMANAYFFTMRKPDEALSYLQGIYGQAGVDKSAQGRAVMILGQINTYRGKYADAMPLFQKCTALNSDSTQVRQAVYWQGLTSDLDGNRQQAIQFYQRSATYPPSAGALKNLASADELAQTRVNLAFRSGEYATSIRLADELLKKQSLDNDIRAQTLYISARAAFDQNDFAQAETRFLQILTVSTTDDIKWIQPATHCRLGIAQAKLGKKAEAKQHLDQALTYKDYDNDDTIRRMSYRELSRLTKQ
jgi:tetratricopeptide (TPR) repeat protein